MPVPFAPSGKEQLAERFRSPPRPALPTSARQLTQAHRCHVRAANERLRDACHASEEAEAEQLPQPQPTTDP
jgi:hypothetical protein